MEQTQNEETLEIKELPSEEISLGQILREKRQNLKISVEEVALYLKVKIRDIEAIESDEIGKIVNHIYITGLLRSYAKFIGISQEIVEEKIDQLHIASNTSNKKHQLINIGENLELTPDKHLLINFSIASILLFFILLSIYNFSENKTPKIKSDNLTEEFKKIDMQ